MASGTVKWFNEKKGFGFIAQEGGGRDVFVHHSVIEGGGFKTLAQGEKVEFEAMDDGEKGPRASKVIRLDPPDAPVKPAAPALSQRGNLSHILAEAMGKGGARAQLRGGLD